MRIVVFGSEKCKYCKKQVEAISKTFDQSEWLYLDVFKNKEALEIADYIDVDKLPTIVLLNSKMQKIFQKEGTMPCDEIFKILNSQTTVIPFTKEASLKVSNGNKKFALLSYEPNFKVGDIVSATDYSGEAIGKLKITSIGKSLITEIKDKFGEEALNEYVDHGGRINSIYTVEFGG